MNMLKLNAVAALALTTVLLSSCSRNPTEPSQTSGNLIPNPSFEINGKPSLEYWMVTAGLASVVQDAPPNDGAWSLQLVPGWLPQNGLAQTNVGGESGVYRLTVWVKSVNQWSGHLSLGVWSGDRWLNQKSVIAQPSQWSVVSIIDTLSLAPQDSIGVVLSAGATEVSNGEVRFANVTLERQQ